MISIKQIMSRTNCMGVGAQIRECLIMAQVSSIFTIKFLAIAHYDLFSDLGSGRLPMATLREQILIFNFYLIVCQANEKDREDDSFADLNEAEVMELEALEKPRIMNNNG